MIQMDDSTRRRIKQLRTERNWSQAELSRRTGIHSSTISHLEAGHMKLWQGHARRIAQALNVTVDDLRGAA
jgi:transcriptional regulator with XRE-family HTH domain